MSTSQDPYLEGLLKKDPKTVKSIYTDFAPRIEAMIVRNGGSQEAARDVFQEALIVIWRKARKPGFKLSSSFYTYLYSVCVYTWQRKRKKKDNNTVTISAAEGLRDDENIQNELEKTERYRIFRKYFEALGPQCKRLMEMFLAGRKMQDIADTLGIENDHAARNRKYRCQKKLENSILKDPHYKELSSRN